MTDPPFTTVAERKARERDRRIGAAGEIVARMRAYAGHEGGRFIVFGSFAAGRMTHDSDLDVMIDFPSDKRRKAWAFLEALSVKHGLRLDLFDRETTKATFVARVEGEGLRLP